MEYAGFVVRVHGPHATRRDANILRDLPLFPVNDNPQSGMDVHPNSGVLDTRLGDVNDRLRWSRTEVRERTRKNKKCRDGSTNKDCPLPHRGSSVSLVLRIGHQ